MSGTRSADPDLVESARQILSLLSAEDILVQTCRGAGTLAGAACVVGSFLFYGQEWNQGVHVVVDQEPHPVPPAARSAGFALFRRLSAARRTVVLTPAAESSAIFEGLSVCLDRPAAALGAVPIVRRNGRVVGQLILVGTEAGCFDSLQEEALELLARCASAAFENALKFASAKRDQDRLHLLAEATEEAVWDWNLERDEIWWGGGIQNLVGRGGVTIEPSPQWKYGRIHPSDVERVQQSLKRALASTQSSWREEYRFLRADGSWVVLEERGYLLREADGRAYRAIGSLRDISELKRSNERLRILSEISRTFSQAILTSTEAFDLIARTVTETLGDTCTIGILSDDGGRLETVGFYDVNAEQHGPRWESLKTTPLDARDGFGGAALRAGQPLLLQTVSREQLEVLVRTPVYREFWSDATTIMAAPMFVSGSPVGALVMSRRGPRHFTAQDSMLLQDIADRAALAMAHVKQTRALERSEQRFRSLAEASAQVVWTTDPNGWAVEDSPSWRAFTGRTLQQWLGLAWLEALHPEDRERVRKDWLQAVTYKAHVEMEYRVQRPDGSYTWMAASAAPVLNKDGTVREWIGTNTDITGKKRVEEQQEFLISATVALAESLDVEATVVKAARVASTRIADWCGITLLDERSGKPGRVTLAHRDAARTHQVRAVTAALQGDGLSSIGASYVLGTGAAQLLPRIEEEHLRAVVREHPELEPEIRAFTPRSLLAVPMRVAAGRLLGAITLVTTEESKRSYGASDLAFAEEFARRCAIAIENAQLFQQAQEAIRARDEFLSIASHELKTPLTPLQLQIHTLEKKLREYAREEKVAWLAHRLVTIRRQSDRLNRLISDLLDLSRIVGGRLALDPELLDVTSLVREIVADFKEHGELDRAQSEVHLQLEGPLVGQWDRMRLEQVLINLLSNALKYGAGKPVTISVVLSDGRAQLTVEDRGIGIAPLDQERIFGRFERAVSARHYGGLGMGLFIVRQIVEAMGGTIRVVSSLGEGAKFIVQLPLEQRRTPSTEPPQPTLVQEMSASHPDAEP
ncbi:MAG TPA: PAS domain-containing protein [Myxococcaceae bacterium]